MSKKLKRLAIAAATSLALGFGLEACQGTAGDCVQDMDCAKGEACVAGSCQASAFQSCLNSTECPSGDFCPYGQCLPDCTKLGCRDGETCNVASHFCDAIVTPSPTSLVNGGGNGGVGGGAGGGSTGNGSTGSAVSGSSSGNSAYGSGGSSGGVGSTSGSSSGGVSSGGVASTSGSASGGASSGGGSTSSGGSSSGGSTGAAECTADTWANYAEAFFATNCTSCHNANSSLDDFTSYSTVVGDGSEITKKIKDGSMPPSGGLSSTDQTRIEKWISCGEPQ
jgi:hypothetical protein